MRLAHQESTGKWVVYYNDAPIAISGQTHFDSREAAIEQIATRGLQVKDNGDIFRPVEPVLFQAPETPEVLPATAPAADEEPEHGDNGAWHEGTEVIEATPGSLHVVLEMDPDVTEDDIVPIPLDFSGVPAAVKALSEAITSGEYTGSVTFEVQDVNPQAVALLKGDKIPETQEEPAKRGRPRTYSPEEAIERRREQNRKYYHARKEARKAEVAARASTWWEEHPEKVEEYRGKANEKRRSRYADDPEYRAKVSAYNREYQAKKRAERQAAKAAAQATPPEA